MGIERMPRSASANRLAGTLTASIVAALVGCLTLVDRIVGEQPSSAPGPQGGRETADESGRHNPYADNNGDQLPPGYTGPRYRLNHDYPTSAPKPPADPPWIVALNGQPISQANAVAYVQALKDYIAPDMQVLVDDYANWDPIKRHWYDQPWIALKIGNWPGREPIQGTYPGPGFDSTTYPDLKNPMQDYVAVYYNEIAAHTLNQIWQRPNPYSPNPASAQFAEASIVVKLALTTASGDDWPPMKGSSKSQVFVPPFDGSSPTPKLTDVYVLQFDLIVKDSKTAPKTGWVFATLVYDKDAPGKTTWEKLVPLGAMWGNDPNVNSTVNPDAPLAETVVNPAAPAYSKITLGWGGRLSGPNDDAAGQISGQFQRFSSCMSCHGTGEIAQGNLVPLAEMPGSPQWMQWFQDRSGTQPQDPGQIALDYDMVSSQALTNWGAAKGTPEGLRRLDRKVKMLRARGRGRSEK
jgi:hypothetical protein